MKRGWGKEVVDGLLCLLLMLMLMEVTDERRLESYIQLHRRTSNYRQVPHKAATPQ